MTIDELKQTTLVNQQGKLLRLKDVAEIEDGFVPQSAVHQLTDNWCLSFHSRTTWFRHLRTDKNLEKSIQSLLLVADKEQIKIHTELFKPANFIDASIKGLRVDIIIGAVLVIAILYLFLFNFRTAFILRLQSPYHFSLLSAL